jgi:FkbM family methyltransferase
MDKELIYDVGMNNGEDTAYYLHRGYRVVAIEADPTLVEKAAERFGKEIKQGRLKLLNVAIGPEEGVAPFWICEGKSEWNSFSEAMASKYGRKCHAIDVQCRRFGDILKEHGVPYYLKVDIEGHDHFCIADIDPKDSPQFVSMELSRLEDFTTLTNAGYDAFKVITQNDHRQLSFGPPSFKTWLKMRLQPYPRLFRLGDRLGTFKSWLAKLWPLRRNSATRGPMRASNGQVFSDFSSGPFGDATDGQWQTVEEAALCWLYFRRYGYFQYGPVSHIFWFDVHATKLGRTGHAADPAFLPNGSNRKA